MTTFRTARSKPFPLRNGRLQLEPRRDATIGRNRGCTDTAAGCSRAGCLEDDAGPGTTVQPDGPRAERIFHAEGHATIATTRPAHNFSFINKHEGFRRAALRQLAWELYESVGIMFAEASVTARDTPAIVVEAIQINGAGWRANLAGGFWPSPSLRKKTTLRAGGSKTETFSSLREQQASRPEPMPIRPETRDVNVPSGPCPELHEAGDGRRQRIILPLRTFTPGLCLVPVGGSGWCRPARIAHRSASRPVAAPRELRV